MDNQHTLIKGYRDLSQEEIDGMNKLKALAEEVGKAMQDAEAMPGVDKRWLAIGRTQLQQGFMAAIRGIARPTTF